MHPGNFPPYTLWLATLEVWFGFFPLFSMSLTFCDLEFSYSNAFLMFLPANSNSFVNFGLVLIGWFISSLWVTRSCFSLHAWYFWLDIRHSEFYLGGCWINIPELCSGTQLSYWKRFNPLMDCFENILGGSIAQLRANYSPLMR